MGREGGKSASQLGRLSAIADPELAGLRAEELLDSVLDRVKTVLEVDTVGVLLLDRGGTRLVARASRGLEEEVRQGFAIPVGGGFAGRIALARAPVRLSEVHAGTVLNPILLDKGIRSLLGVPLLSAGVLVGVMHVGSVRPRSFDDDDVAVLQYAAERVATALYAEQTRDDISAARTVQQSLLPARLPQVDGLEFASRFVAAEQSNLGGDWFDAFLLPDERVGIVMGDVTGHGLRAAIVMGRLRSALRAYALDSPPAETLDRLNRKFLHFEPGQMATVLYLTVAADRSSVELASAGHPPPLVAPVGHDVQFLDCCPRPPIGVDADRRHHSVTQELAPGTTVACFTDGLYERRTEPIDVQLEKLRTAMSPGHPETVCNAVMRTMVGSDVLEDDTALLVFRSVR